MALALALLVLGGGRAYQVYQNPALQPPAGESVTLPTGETLTVPESQPDEPSFPKLTALSISDSQLVENATFTGVIRSDHLLYFTYDPTKPRGRQACPT